MEILHILHEFFLMIDCHFWSFLSVCKVFVWRLFCRCKFRRSNRTCTNNVYDIWLLLRWHPRVSNLSRSLFPNCISLNLAKHQVWSWCRVRVKPEPIKKKTSLNKWSWNISSVRCRRNIDVCKVCRDSDGEDWLRCGSCKQLFHASCIKVDFSKTLSGYFVCPC